MLTSLRIQNFRSIRDASVKLGQVNLFIGPNNSGKSNFLKGINLMADAVENYPVDFHLEMNEFTAMLPRVNNKTVSTDSIRFIFKDLSNADSLSVVIGALGVNNVVSNIKLFSSVYINHKIDFDPYDEEPLNRYTNV
ncbi:AAA family ATPase [Hymenobacter sp. PAMC 26628]|uniref:AAA family ATPase n=1 Tax=Hymenobacter sp. PAMC 26628 TaxID=1484118 RepID=UPI0009020711|nr:AAA family ATPase [Hymenobacter sp. PAMC 26628]